MRTKSAIHLWLCALLPALLPTDAAAQVVPFDFRGTGESYSDTQAVANAIASARNNAGLAGYSGCQLRGYTYYPSSTTTWTAAAFMTCYKDLTPPPTQPPPGPPPAPTIYPPSREGADHTVSWSSTLNPGRYALERSFNAGNWKQVYKGGNTRWTATAPAAGAYRYRVMLITGAHEVYSPIVEIQVSSAPPVPPPPLTPVRVGPDHTIQWVAVPGATGYELERAGEDGSWSTLYVGPATRWIAVDTPLGTYRHRVKACANGVCSATSSEGVFRVELEMAPIVNYLLQP
ncbi:hypothetical protein ACI2IY_06465 [Lysobacter enzymogenes]|uniref:hypothetical protein n=1 Tax=Lysobacter enzymogenes TaxID=69 RepID=UPI00385042BD